MQTRIPLPRFLEIDLHPLLVEQDIQNFVAAVLCGDVQRAAAQAVLGRVEELCGFRGGGETREQLVEEVCVIAPARFEEDLAGGCALCSSLDESGPVMG